MLWRLPSRPAPVACERASYPTLGCDGAGGMGGGGVAQAPTARATSRTAWPLSTVAEVESSEGPPTRPLAAAAPDERLPPAAAAPAGAARPASSAPSASVALGAPLVAAAAATAVADVAPPSSSTANWPLAYMGFLLLHEMAKAPSPSGSRPQ